MKPVKSTDPRKPAIVAALKKASGCSKITNVKEYIETATHAQFSGDCLRKMDNNAWENLGPYYVRSTEVFHA